MLPLRARARYDRCVPLGCRRVLSRPRVLSKIAAIGSLCLLPQRSPFWPPPVSGRCGRKPISLGGTPSMNTTEVMPRRRSAASTGSTGRTRTRARAADDRPPEVSNEPLIPVQGVLDIVGNSALVRADGYAPGPDDVHVSPALVKQYGLRRGDEITGAARPRGDSVRGKYDPLVRVDAVNGRDPESARKRPEFYNLTPLFPQERLRLETEPHLLATRVIDLVMPIGKGQRALIVSPPKAGKTTLLQAIANAVTHNNPECHLMVLLVD